MKKYRLLIETAELPKGSIAKEQENGLYHAHYGDINFDKPLHRISIENRHEVWELVSQEPAKEKVENEYLPFVPNEEERCWFIYPEGNITTCLFTDLHNDCITQGVFRTEQSAKYEALRRESMSKRYRPKNGERYFAYDFDGSVVEDVIFGPHSYSDYLLGNCHKTREDAEHYRDKFGEAWEVLL